MKLYIDFDHTIFNTTLFQDDIKKIDKNINIQENIERLKEIVRNNNLNLEKYLYPDVKPFLDKYKTKYTMILLTKSNNFNAYQLFKIQESGISNYFDNIIILKSKLKGELEINYQDGIFLDDNSVELENIFLKKPYNIIRLKRGKYKDRKLNINIKEVTSLLEINL